MTSEQIANMVRYFRKQAGLSQHKLAQLAGVGKTVVFDVEKGKPTVQLDSLLKILSVLNIKLTFETPFAELTERKV
jgi:HTH-type transcriptional regulator/antitoxin HipB